MTASRDEQTRLTATRRARAVLALASGDWRRQQKSSTNQASRPAVCGVPLRDKGGGSCVFFREGFLIRIYGFA